MVVVALRPVGQFVENNFAFRTAINRIGIKGNCPGRGKFGNCYRLREIVGNIVGLGNAFFAENDKRAFVDV